MSNQVRALCQSCEEHLNLQTCSLSKSYYYDSLPLCVIDAVFSIGVRYTSTQNVVKNYCNYFGLREYNLCRDENGDQHSITSFIANIEKLGIQASADRVFCNHQRTSSRNGILKAEAVLRFAKVLQKYGFEKLRDLQMTTVPKTAEDEIKAIPGQKSGLALHYFYMLAGDDQWAKPDRHVLRFIQISTGQLTTVEKAQELLFKATLELKSRYPKLTVRLLDYAIWDYMAHGQPLANELSTEKHPHRS